MPRAWVSSPTYKQLIGILVEVRRERGFTQRQVAEKLDRPASFVAKIELGERRLDVLEFISLAEALGVAPTELFGRIDRTLTRPFE